MNNRKKKKDPNKITAGKVIGKIIKYILLIALAVILMGGSAALGVMLGAKHSAPKLTVTTILPTSDPTVILDDSGNEIIQLSSQGARRTEATSEEIPETLKWAFVDLEDERFYEHNGIDFKGILRAAYVVLTSSRKEGASTITQQLIKNNVFETGGFERSTGATVKRKIQEWFLAMDLEKQMTKDEILLNYLNSLFLSSGNYGVKEGASYYFGKELKDLSIAECAVIASITQNPSANNPARHPENNWERATKCLRQMYENGHITKEEYDAALNEDVFSHIVAVANSSAGNEIYSYYVDALIEQVLEDMQEDLGYTYAQAYNALYSGGLTIYSNQNTAAQEIIDREINNEENYEGFDITYSISWELTVTSEDGSVQNYNQNHLTKYFKELYGDDWVLDFDSKEAADQAIEEFKASFVKESDKLTEKLFYTLQPQASFTLMDYTTGKVIGLCGGRGEKETSLSLNRATDTNRQPGSTFKIVAAFGPALDMGKVTLATTFDDEPFSYPDTGKKVANWWGDSYMGLSTIRMGIQESMNVVACKTMWYAGPWDCLQYVRSFGYESIPDSDAVLSTAIGGVTYGVTNLENCAAYSAIANDGVYKEPLFYSKIVTKDGTVLIDTEQTQESHRVIQLETASLLTNAMQDVVTKGTGVACDIGSAPLAGKTGTTNDYRDLWFVGYVPNGLCGSIWVGYDENMTLDANTEVQKKFYSIVMDQLVENLGRGGGNFELKGNIVKAVVCSKSGLLSNGTCTNDPEGNMLINEYFAGGTVPTDSCRVHQTIKICKTTQKIANKYCDETENVVRRFRMDPLDTFGIDNYVHGGTTADSFYSIPSTCTEHSEKTTTTTTTTKETTKETTEDTSETEDTTADTTEPTGETSPDTP